jgi:hypothetical protein
MAGQRRETISPLDGEGGEAEGRAGWGEHSVIPAEAGIQRNKRSACGFWIPAFAGMTWLRFERSPPPGAQCAQVAER